MGLSHPLLWMHIPASTHTQGAEYQREKILAFPWAKLPVQAQQDWWHRACWRPCFPPLCLYLFGSHSSWLTATNLTSPLTRRVFRALPLAHACWATRLHTVIAHLKLWWLINWRQRRQLELRQEPAKFLIKFKTRQYLRAYTKPAFVCVSVCLEIPWAIGPHGGSLRNGKISHSYFSCLF